VVDNSPASRAGLKADDQIISVAGRMINKPDALSSATNDNAGKTVTVVTERGGQVTTQQITLNASSPHLGVAPYSAETGMQIRRSTWSAPIVAIGVMKDFTIATMKGLGTAMKGLGSTIAGFFSGNKQARQAGQEEAGSQVSGPVGIFTVLYQIAHQGFGLVLFVVAIISLTLAIMNVLPIPALDGGRLFVMLLYRALHRTLKPKTEERIHGTGFAVLMLLFVVITIIDIRRFF
jgi:regulator of sigma E protease